jgi:molybdate transport system substrate-binding protein
MAADYGDRRLEVFAGSVSIPVLRELIPVFQEKTGATVRLHVGGSGAMLSQMILSGRGDVYLPGSSDFMELAKERGLVDPKTERRLAYLLPTLCVAADNPKNINSLDDLSKPGVRVALGRPDTVCVGLYGVEVLERAGLAEKVRPNVVAYTESCTKTAQLLSMGLVDAVLGWDVFAAWNGGEIKVIPLSPDELARVGYIPVAVTKNASEPELAALFVSLFSGEEGAQAYRRNGYLTEIPAALTSGNPSLEIGGRYLLPDGWK